MFSGKQPAGFCELTECIKDHCIGAFTQQYKLDNVTFGNNGQGRLSKRQAYCTLGKFPSDEENIQLIKDENHYSGHYFLVNSHGNDVNGRYSIDVWADELPKDIAHAINEEFYKFVEIIGK